MERQFCINWLAIVEEAKQRRKRQKLTQQRLAELAGVSTPTISRFERGERDIQVSTATRILGVLGMTDERTLVFPESDPRWMGEAVLFTGQDGDQVVRCAIRQEALEDHFDGDDKHPLKVFRTHRSRIEYEARRKYLAGRLEPDRSVLISTLDL